MNAFEQIREQSAKIAEFEDVPTYKLGGRMHDDGKKLKANIAEAIRAMPLPPPEVSEEIIYQVQLRKGDFVDVTENEYNVWPNGKRILFALPPDAEALRAENERLRNQLAAGAEKAIYWFECLRKCGKLLELDEDTPISSGVVAAVEQLVKEAAKGGA